VGTSFDASYQKVSTIFQTTGMALLKTVDYQSLICLGVLPAQSLLAQLQTDKMDIKTSFNKDFVQLENEIASLQEKYRIQQDMGVDMLNGVTYDAAQNQIKADIDKIVSIHTGMVQTFELGYKTKILKFISDYAQYLTQNKDLLQTINAKIVKLQYLISQSTAIQSWLNSIYTNLQISDIMDKVPTVQNALQQVFLANVVPYIDTQVKKFKVATTLSWALLGLKDTTLSQYNQDKDTYLAKIVAPWYNYPQYLKTQQEIQQIKDTYYTAGKLNCTQVLLGIPTATQDKIFADVASTLQNISSGVALSKWNTSLKTTFLSGIQSFLTSTTAQKILGFKKSAESLLAQTIKALQTSGKDTDMSSGTTTPPAQPASVPLTKINATKAFTLNQYHKDIGILQTLLTTKWYYTGAINNTYTPATKSAVYAFQRAMGISTPSKALQGYFGPATKAKVNSLLK